MHLVDVEVEVPYEGEAIARNTPWQIPLTQVSAWTLGRMTGEPSAS